MLYSMTFLALSAALLAQDKPGDDAKKELDRIQGTWVCTVFELDGRKAPSEFAGQIKLVCTGDKYVQFLGKQEVENGTHKLDPSKKPKHMDISIVEGDGKGMLQLGIYEIEGDTFKICVNKPGEKERPKELISKPGSGHALVVLKREKKEEKKNEKKDK